MIDNFEHLLAAAVLVSELIEMAPSIQVLVTSRSALRIRGERLFKVEPLGLPLERSRDAIVQSPAVQLFMQRALAVDPELQLDGADHTAIAAICTALDGLPLAIELAAARCQLLTVAQIREQLSQPLSIGERGLRDLPDRQQTLHATMAWSYQLLTATAQSVLRCAGVFLGGFTAPGLEYVTGRTIGTELAELREASLVRRQTDPGRFELLELVRAFALGLSESTGETAQACARHEQYFADVVAPISAEFDAGTAFGELQSCCAPTTPTFGPRSGMPWSRGICSRPPRCCLACGLCGLRATSARSAANWLKSCWSAFQYLASRSWRCCGSPRHLSIRLQPGSGALPNVPPS